MKTKQHAFTLVELMITIAILGILVLVAVPAYQEQTQKTRRSDAKSALTTAASMQERWFTQNNSYTNDIDNIGGDTSEEEYYDIDVEIPGFGGVAGPASCVDNSTGVNRFYCFRVIATAQGGQLDDTNCRRLILDHTGARTSENAGGGASTGCW